ncbi:hypothetical protein [Acinetobacter courvalinii]|uniref:Uncharacterized protein n=1 Tax=Acinetobacter courvalinii TaxID=280147 RepID=N9RQ93_9GAMM|nr:hypothetical protein [Acinetobacter courvalinii]ENX40895.1 hypothetical protein F888_00382 [Acinetobacter courvalinii]KAB0661318.1 hypothetical protein F7P77_01915 [Acinetobacter courvalinii]RSN79926.1 hypothetical protein EA770_16940 [Acinetobacter baumannii]GGH43890.1 hypothetical protein GCM10007354_32610 [Acinetobacter courvalinii]
MKRWLIYLTLILFPLFFLNGCKDDNGMPTTSTSPKNRINVQLDILQNNNQTPLSSSTEAIDINHPLYIYTQFFSRYIDPLENNNLLPWKSNLEFNFSIKDNNTSILHDYNIILEYIRNNYDSQPSIIVFTDKTNNSRNQYNCGLSPTNCEGVLINFNPNTGQSKITFSNTKLLGLNNTFPLELNGTLTGELEIPPYQVNKIPSFNNETFLSIGSNTFLNVKIDQVKFTNHDINKIIATINDSYFNSLYIDTSNNKIKNVDLVGMISAMDPPDTYHVTPESLNNISYDPMTLLFNFNNAKLDDIDVKWGPKNIYLNGQISP